MFILVEDFSLMVEEERVGVFIKKKRRWRGKYDLTNLWLRLIMQVGRSCAVCMTRVSMG